MNERTKCLKCGRDDRHIFHHGPTYGPVCLDCHNLKCQVCKTDKDVGWVDKKIGYKTIKGTICASCLDHLEDEDLKRIQAEASQLKGEWNMAE